MVVPPSGTDRNLLPSGRGGRQYGLYVWLVGQVREVLSRAGARRRLEQVSGGVLLLLGVRLALEG
jgi:hypothetical protein